MPGLDGVFAVGRRTGILRLGLFPLCLTVDQEEVEEVEAVEAVEVDGT